MSRKWPKAQGRAALGFTLVTGKALGISPLIGILMLMGIAAKNSIPLSSTLWSQRRSVA